jgi:antirestriction protein ArdC
MTTETATPVPATFADLLNKAVSEPGTLSTAFRAFHGYSIGNQLLALFQCIARDIEPGPIATFMSWKAKGRSVRKGAKALVLCMPVTCKRKATDEERAAEPDVQDATFTRFVYKPHWFVLSQTDGVDVVQTTVDDWDPTRALAALDVTRAPFAMLDGNCQGYAKGRTIAVSPVAEHAHRTMLHELAHVVLGHTANEAVMSDDARPPYNLGEVEAEAVAFICGEILGLDGAAESRGYLQHWNATRGAEPIPERSAQKIFKAADTILRAGREPEATVLAA